MIQETLKYHLLFCKDNKSNLNSSAINLLSYSLIGSSRINLVPYSVFNMNIPNIIIYFLHIPLLLIREQAVKKGLLVNTLFISSFTWSYSPRAKEDFKRFTQLCILTLEHKLHCKGKYFLVLGWISFIGGTPYSFFLLPLKLFSIQEIMNGCTTGCYFY